MVTHAKSAHQLNLNLSFNWNILCDSNLIHLQGTPTKGEAPAKVEKKVDDKENVFLPVDEEQIQPISLVNESFKLDEASDKLLSFKQLSDQAKASDMDVTVNDKYDCIAMLDDAQEDEKWEERTAVITKNDHEEYIAAAESILSDILAEMKPTVTRYV